MENEVTSTPEVDIVDIGVTSTEEVVEEGSAVDCDSDCEVIAPEEVE
jgi:hypothetical protein